jgi:hypothetical protein
MKPSSSFAGGLAAIASLLDGTPENVAHRFLQFELPDYTSPPLPEAIAATPEAFQADEAVENARALDASGLCSESPPEACQILFEPSKEAIKSGTSKIGVMFYNGALVDPRGYSLIGQILAARYGIPVAMPIFAADLATITTANGTCGSGRVPLAAAAFPYVEKWVLAGHSYGGIAAQNDFWSLQEDDSIAGLVLMGSYIRQDVCDVIDFSQTNFPMAVVQGSLDGVITWENVKNATELYPPNDTFHMEIMGGNHGYFGTYNDSERTPLLGQVDGQALIPNSVQRELSIGAILHVASRLGLPLPTWETSVAEDDSTSAIDDPLVVVNSTDPPVVESDDGEDVVESDDGEDAMGSDSLKSGGCTNYVSGILLPISVLFMWFH